MLEIKDEIKVTENLLGSEFLKDVRDFRDKLRERIREERFRLHRLGEYWPNNSWMLSRADRELIKRLSEWDAITFTLAEKIFHMPTLTPPDLAALPYKEAKRYLYDQPHLAFI